MPSPNDVFGLFETIKEFTFRQSGGVEILKEWREIAVILQVDIEIISISRDEYLNYSSLPASGFYGYATLVYRDYALPPIQLTQPRQSIYYAVNEFAQSAWMEYHQMIRLQENFKGVEQLICFNTGLLGGACISSPCKPIPEPSFIEFPLREVIINSFFGTQFKIEVSYWKINDILNNCGDLVSPKSGQVDGDKDDGLPENGVAPQKASDPNDPYAGLPQPTDSETDGVLDDEKLSNLDESNPDNAIPSNEGATETTEGYYWEVIYRTRREAAFCDPVGVKYYVAGNRDTVFRLGNRVEKPPTVCGSEAFQDWSIVDASDESVVFSTTSAIIQGGQLAPFFKFGLLPAPTGAYLLEEE